MSKYDHLGTYLREQGAELIPMTFAEIERVVGAKLPKSQEHQAWWSNSTSNNVMTQVWLDAGYRTEQVDVAARKLVFRRVAHASGMQEEPSMFRHAEPSKVPFPPPPGTKLTRHPASGVLKGMVTIEPGYDIASSDPEDVAEWEAAAERTADLVASGAKRRS
jgi:hypothetical protein